MKKEVFSVTLLLLAMTALSRASSQHGFTVQSGPVEVKQGNNVSLWCKLKYDSNSEAGQPVLWLSPPDLTTRTKYCETFGSSILKHKYVMSCAKDDVMHAMWYNMTITDVQWVDKGEYRCIHVKDVGIVYLQVSVPVTNVSLTYVPSSEKQLLSLTNENVVLTCTTNCAHPAPNISWFENDQPFNDIARPTVNITKSGCSGEKEGQKRTISTVTVTGKYVDKTRTISCTAENVGEQVVSKAVDIKHNAILTGACSENTSALLSETVEVKQGNNISLWCKITDKFVNGVPVHWQSPPNFKTRTSNCDTFGPAPVKQKYVMSCAKKPSICYNMTITNVRWQDRGKYRCIHTVHMGIVELKVLIPVAGVSLTHNLTSTANSLHMSKNVNAVLTCTTDCAYPAPTILWLEKGQPFKGNPIVNVTELACTGDEEGQKRTISTLTVTDKYVKEERLRSPISCMADNGIKESKISRSIDITYEDPCERVRCQVGRVCQATSMNLGVCVCGHPDVCQDQNNQVCGDDGIMYSSLCELHRTACIKDKHIGVAHTNNKCKSEDPCESVKCPPGRVCRATSNNPGVCVCGPPDLCNDHLDQVCGDDGVVYSSNCELERMACIKDKHIGVDHTNNTCKSEKLPIGYAVAIAAGIPLIGVTVMALIFIYLLRSERTR